MLTRPIFAEYLQHFVHFGPFSRFIRNTGMRRREKIRAQGLNKRAKIL